LFVFTRLHPGALGSRFSYVTYVTPAMTWGEIARRFISNYAGSFNPWLWFVAGDPEPRHHVQTMGSLLVGPVLLAILGLLLIFAKPALRKDRWWWFVVFGLLIAPLPSALTIDHFHTLRLVALPIFLLVLTVPAIAWLLDRRSRSKQLMLAVLVVATLIQGVIFQRQFHNEAPRRWHNFDTFYPEIFRAAVAMPQRPIYLIDNVGAPGYMHAYWQATLAGMDLKQFVVLPKDKTAPAGSLVISTELPCTDCELILQRAGFRVYVQQ
ncbi:MAG TPA: hypothetical protein VJT50_02375, partial [Pyrinomonadaceae bacterium]|nr:hypothetical protein [Pyrinomonadaceae bacterium]